MKSALTIAFDYRPSRWIAVAASVVVIAAMAAPWFSALPWSAGIALSLAALVSGMAALKRFIYAPFRRIAYQASGWKLVDVDEAEHAVDLKAHTRLGSWFVLDFRRARRLPFSRRIGSGQRRRRNASSPDPAARTRRSRTNRLAAIACRSPAIAALSPSLAVRGSDGDCSRRNCPQGIQGPHVPTFGSLHRLALYAGKAPQPFHLVHFAGVDPRHRGRRDRVDHGDLGDERLRQGIERPHSRHGFARDDFGRRRNRTRLAGRARYARRQIRTCSVQRHTSSAKRCCKVRATRAR